MAYNDGLQQCLTSSRSKTHEKKFGGGGNFGPNGPKSGQKLGFSLFSPVWFISFPLNCIDDNLELCLTTS